VKKRSIAYTATTAMFMALLVACSEKPTPAPAAVTPPPIPAATPAQGFDLPAHSDENWVNGIAKGWGAAYFVMLAPGVQEAMAPGSEVTFADGSKRIIQSTRINGDSLIVNVDGAPLDGTRVGHPNKLKVTKASK
jgi:hypothetical protein